MYDLELLAKNSGTKWTYSEVVATVHFIVRDLPHPQGVEHLRASLSPYALSAIQKAAQGVLQNTGPDIEWFSMGYTSSNAPATFDDSNRVSISFVHYLAAHLVPTSNT